MTEQKTDLKLIRMSEVKAEEIRWLWYPYLPRSKLSILQGDPGEGKTTLALRLAALLTCGKVLPGADRPLPPMSVIYQTAEDGLRDTIKPRLEAAGADCSRVLVIDESEKELSMSDERMEQAIRETGAGLLVLDPLQAYLGGSVDMYRANEVRPVVKGLASVAERTGCAILLVGHLNKSEKTKSAYRGLGSIDLRAAARNVLFVGRSQTDDALRYMIHDKSNLAVRGKTVCFLLDPDAGFQWAGFSEVTADELLDGRQSTSKTSQAEELLRELLAERSVETQVLMERAAHLGIGERTVKLAKKNLGATSQRVDGKWFTTLPEQVKGVRG